MALAIIGSVTDFANASKTLEPSFVSDLLQVDAAQMSWSFDETFGEFSGGKPVDLPFLDQVVANMFDDLPGPAFSPRDRFYLEVQVRQALLQVPVQDFYGTSMTGLQPLSTIKGGCDSRSTTKEARLEGARSACMTNLEGPDPIA